MNYLLTGNSFLIDEKLSEIKSECLKTKPDILLENIDAEDATLAQIIELISSTSLFSSSKLVVLKRLGNNKQVSQHIEQIIEAIIDTVELILVEPAIDKRSSYYKYLLSDKRIKHYDNKIESIDLWVRARVKELGGNISGATVQYLINKAGPDPSLLSFEIKKLIAYDPTITPENIDKLMDVSLMSSVFDLVNAIFVQDKKRAMRLYEEQQFLGITGPAIIGMIAWQLHIFALIKSTDKSPKKISAETKISSYALERSAAVVKNLALQDINQMIKSLEKLDHQSKTISIDVNEALKNWIITQS
ncbi:DNA polymerase III subunit delta [Candidatus Saccharibacteria bacterium RIFCSPHIGHO2_12_FULL_41_12]|nr:MAG: DNA polymerase III subunit delta [Candidatus Saccharibacteria bacterium RIFCSPHIGHO2_12_FULL_41_12]